MAGEINHKQEFVIRNLATRNVALFPAKAHISRNIHDTTLKPGANEITIYSLTPTADEDSIKVDSKGSATITDLMLELVPNREDYDNIYPELSEDEESDEEEDDNDDGSDAESEVVRSRKRKEKKEDEDATKKASEEKASASSRLSMLETYVRSMENDRPKDLGICLSAYVDERRKAFDVHFASEAKLKTLAEEKRILSIKLNKAMHGIDKKKAKATKERIKIYGKKRRAKHEKQDARIQLKRERIDF